MLIANVPLVLSLSRARALAVLGLLAGTCPRVRQRRAARDGVWMTMTKVVEACVSEANDNTLGVCDWGIGRSC